MTDILALLQCLNPVLEKTTLRQMSRIIPALLAMTGRITMQGISRWTEKGGSYRTVQRFFHTVLPWATLFWLFFRHHLLRPSAHYLLVGDESIVTKAGKKTHGLDHFFASLYGRVVPSLAFFALSLVDVAQRRSYPVMVEQVVRSETEKAAAKTARQKKKAKTKSKKGGKRGRPKGSKNRDKTQVTLTPELTRIQKMVRQLLELIADQLHLGHLVLDGHFGNNNTLQMTLQCGLHLISKLRRDAALYFRYDGPQAARGPRRRYGDRLDISQIPETYRRKSTIKKEIRTDIYQAELLHREFAQTLNVVIICKTNLKTGAFAHVILFSSDLALTYEQMIDFYSLRFQIEFNFRDAKQYWGLEDFMNTKETAVVNAANLSLFMVNVAHLLLRDFRQKDSTVNVLDLKAYYRGHKYVAETIKWLPQKPEPILLAQIFEKVSCLGWVHDPLPSLSPS
jgi:putative transposase